jgi:hypothetical protein
MLSEEKHRNTFLIGVNFYPELRFYNQCHNKSSPLHTLLISSRNQNFKSISDSIWPFATGGPLNILK